MVAFVPGRGWLIEASALPVAGSGEQVSTVVGEFQDHSSPVMGGVDAGEVTGRDGIADHAAGAGVIQAELIGDGRDGGLVGIRSPAVTASTTWMCWTWLRSWSGAAAVSVRGCTDCRNGLLSITVPAPGTAGIGRSTTSLAGEGYMFATPTATATNCSRLFPEPRSPTAFRQPQPWTYPVTRNTLKFAKCSASRSTPLWGVVSRTPGLR